MEKPTQNLYNQPFRTYERMGKEMQPDYITIQPDYANCEYRMWGTGLDELYERIKDDREVFNMFTKRLRELTDGAFDVAHRGTRIEFRPLEKRYAGLFEKCRGEENGMAFLRKCHLNMIATAIGTVLEEMNIHGWTPHIFDEQTFPKDKPVVDSKIVELELGDL